MFYQNTNGSKTHNYLIVNYGTYKQLSTVPSTYSLPVIKQQSRI